MATISSGSNTTSIDPYRQGVEIVNFRYRFQQSRMTLGAEKDHNFFSQSNYGQDRFNRLTSGAFKDRFNLTPADYLRANQHVTASLTDDYSDDSKHLNASAEVFPRRELAKFSTRTYKGKFRLLGPSGELMVPPTSNIDRHKIVSQTLYFEDRGGSFGQATSSSVSFTTGSIFVDKLPQFVPFDDTENASLKLTSFISASSDKVSDSGLIYVVNGLLTGSDHYGSSPLRSKSVSAGTGFTYPYSPLRLDSVAFGGLMQRGISGSLTENIAFVKRSRFTNRTPRFMQRLLDNRTGSYPTIVRTGDGDRNGSYRRLFDEKNVINFVSATYVPPTNLPASSPYQAYLNLDSTLTATAGVVKKGVSDPGNLIVPFITQSGQLLTPFNDSNKTTFTTATFFLTGTDPTVKFGFSFPLKSKTQITIDLSAVTSSVLTRYDAGWWDSLDPSGPFAGKNKSGFVYYNRTTKTWQEKGLNDNVTGASTFFSFGISQPLDGTTPATGTTDFPMQFTPSSQLTGGPEGEFSLNTCTPTILAAAPVNMKYHATQSQCYVMSESLKHPFLFEKAVVRLPISVTRTHGGIPNAASASNGNYNSQSYSTECYSDQSWVFFIYRQKRQSTRNRDNAQDVSSSLRYLLGSGTMTFWNNRVFDPTQNQWNNYTLKHTPAFSYNFGVGDTPVLTGSRTVYTFSGTVEFQIQAAAATARVNNYFYVPVNFKRSNLTGTDYKFAPGIKSFWPGGTTYQNLSGAWFGSPNTGSSFDFGAYGVNMPSIKEIDWTQLDFTKLKRGFLIDKIDPRSLTAAGFNVLSIPQRFDAYNSIAPFTTGTVATPNPYLLMPDDELIFGIESALGSTVWSAGEMIAPNNITGSLMTIQPGNASITLFGSLIRRDREFHNTRNQNLTSPALHEIVQDEIVDQFEVDESIFYSGSLHSKIFTGSIFSSGDANTRRVLFDVNSPLTIDNSLTSSFLRGVKISSNIERYYDTIPPDINQYFAKYGSDVIYVAPGQTSAGATSTKNYWYRFNPVPFYLETGTNRLRFPYDGIDSRQTQFKVGFLPYTASGGSQSILYDQQIITDILFKRGNKRSSVDEESTNFRTGSQGFSYGMLNTHPIYSSYVFRRNRFGQVRDMLEQSLQGKFYNTELAQTLDSPVQIKFVHHISGNLVDPSTTWTSNLSFEATSSLPYFDNTVRNREDPINTAQIGTTDVIF